MGYNTGMSEAQEKMGEAVALVRAAGLVMRVPEGAYISEVKEKGQKFIAVRVVKEEDRAALARARLRSKARSPIIFSLDGEESESESAPPPSVSPPAGDAPSFQGKRKNGAGSLAFLSVDGAWHRQRADGGMGEVPPLDLSGGRAGVRQQFSAWAHERRIVRLNAPDVEVAVKRRRRKKPETI